MLSGDTMRLNWKEDRAGLDSTGHLATNGCDASAFWPQRQLSFGVVKARDMTARSPLHQPKGAWLRKGCSPGGDQDPDGGRSVPSSPMPGSAGRFELGVRAQVAGVDRRRSRAAAT